MKRSYELCIVVRTDSNEEVMHDAVNQVKDWIETEDMGTVTKIDRWGRKKLAYEIDRQREGYYVVMEAEMEPEQLPELEENLKLSSSYLRYLIVRPD